MMKVLRLTITPELREALAAEAKRKSLSMSAFVRLLLIEAFGLDKPEQPHGIYPTKTSTTLKGPQDYTTW